MEGWHQRPEKGEKTVSQTQIRMRCPALFGSGFVSKYHDHIYESRVLLCTASNNHLQVRPFSSAPTQPSTQHGYTGCEAWVNFLIDRSWPPSKSFLVTSWCHMSMNASPSLSVLWSSPVFYTGLNALETLPIQWTVSSTLSVLSSPVFYIGLDASVTTWMSQKQGTFFALDHCLSLPHNLGFKHLNKPQKHQWHPALKSFTSTSPRSTFLATAISTINAAIFLWLQIANFQSTPLIRAWINPIATMLASKMAPLLISRPTSYLSPSFCHCVLHHWVRQLFGFCIETLGMSSTSFIYCTSMMNFSTYSYK